MNLEITRNHITTDVRAEIQERKYNDYTELRK